MLGRLGPFEPAPHLAVAVSGGRDSLALARLAHDWAVARDGAVCALIVDHGLRPGSADDARHAARSLRHAGIDSTLLTVRGRPAGNLQAWARTRRYALMTAWCRTNGVLHLLVAHHREDQAETVLAARSGPDTKGPDTKGGVSRGGVSRGGPGMRGSAGMAALRETADCRILRPLLDVPGARLAATLEQRGIEWLEDPANADRRFRRIRLRDALRTSGEAPALAREAQVAGPARQAFERQVADLLARSVAFKGSGVAVRRALLAAADRDLAQAALGALLRWTGGRSEPPRPARLAAFCAWVETGKDGRRSLHGCTATLSKDRLRIAPHADPRSTPPDRHQPLINAAFGALPRAHRQSPGRTHG